MSQIHKLEKTVHADLSEGAEIFADKLKLFPQGCFVLVRDEFVVGYGFSHPWLLMNIPPLHQFLRRLPPSPDCIFIHDVAIIRSERGRGAAGILVGILANLARKLGLRHLAVVSVHDSYPVWARFGFAIVTDAALSAKLETYGGTARYMVRTLS